MSVDYGLIVLIFVIRRLACLADIFKGGHTTYSAATVLSE